jgi:hypothetical protein
MSDPLKPRDRVFDISGDHLGHKHPIPVLRVRPDGYAAVQIAMPMRDGQPVDPNRSMIVGDAEGNYYAEPIAERSPARGSKSGPAQVSTPAYRSNYETIFGARPERGQA